MSVMSDFPGNVPKLFDKKRFYTTQEVKLHNSGHDCWVIIHDEVFDLSRLISHCNTSEVHPLIEVAGTDISHWFELKNGKRETRKTHLASHYTPQGPYFGLSHSSTSPTSPTSPLPWWDSESEYKIGDLCREVRKVIIRQIEINKQRVITVSVRDTIGEIKKHYHQFNQHCYSYVWKYDGHVLDDEKTLEENGLPYHEPIVQKTFMKEELFYPLIDIYFSDDLTCF